LLLREPGGNEYIDKYADRRDHHREFGAGPGAFGQPFSQDADRRTDSPPRLSPELPHLLGGLSARDNHHGVHRRKCRGHLDDQQVNQHSQRNHEMPIVTERGQQCRSRARGRRLRNG
jgi:hypothetical protein